MKLYKITLKPTSGIGTPFKGDTIFGRFCWQAASDPDLLNGGLEKWIAMYPERPFAVFSSARPSFANDAKSVYALKKPDLPMEYLTGGLPKSRKQVIETAKDLKKEKWILLEDGLKLDIQNLNRTSDKDLRKKAYKQLTEPSKRAMLKSGREDFVATEIRAHNTINRQTQTTGTPPFAPYSREVQHYYPETELALFVLLDEEATDVDRVTHGLEQIGKFGFGRDASTGLGRFDVLETDELPPPDPTGMNAAYTLAPCVPEPGVYGRMYYAPFTRFGKHGDVLAVSGNPFKNPVLMADEGAVLVPRDPAVLKRPYLGRAVTGVSKVQPEAVVQGYSIHIPFKLEACNDQ